MLDLRPEKEPSLLFVAFIVILSLSFRRLQIDHFLSCARFYWPFFISCRCIVQYNRINTSFKYVDAYYITTTAIGIFFSCCCSQKSTV